MKSKFLKSKWRNIIIICFILFIHTSHPILATTPYPIPSYQVICDVNIFNQTSYRDYWIAYHLETIKCAGCYYSATKCSDENRYLDDVIPEETNLLMIVGEPIEEFRINQTYRISGKIVMWEEPEIIFDEILNDSRDLLTIANEKYEFTEEPSEIPTENGEEALPDWIVSGGLIFLFIFILVIIIIFLFRRKR